MNKTRTKRVVFMVGQEKGFTEEAIDFDWYMGMNWQLRVQSSLSLQENILALYPNRKVLEVSTKSDNYELGKALSAFNLMLGECPVETVFQSSKVFDDGGPYTDLLSKTPVEAKKDPRISTGKGIRHLVSFRLNGIDFPTEPKSFFYDYIYISALSKNLELAEKIASYDTFTDIEFNQKIPYSSTKGPFNCQARSCAIFVWLKRKGLLEDYLADPTKFIGSIYPIIDDIEAKQISLF